jgi:hypothetical protein
MSKKGNRTEALEQLLRQASEVEHLWWSTKTRLQITCMYYRDDNEGIINIKSVLKQLDELSEELKKLKSSLEEFVLEHRGAYES